MAKEDPAATLCSGHLWGLDWFSCASGDHDPDRVHGIARALARLRGAPGFDRAGQDQCLARFRRPPGERETLPRPAVLLFQCRAFEGLATVGAHLHRLDAPERPRPAADLD